MLFRSVELKNEGATILLVEQNAAKTIEAADRTWVMSNGEAEMLEARDGAVSQAELLAAYLGRH